jgi:GNAT superfamily N-acetyltransferase
VGGGSAMSGAEARVSPTPAHAGAPATPPSGRKDRADVSVRSFVDADLPAVLDLMTASLGGGPAGHRSEAFFRWKHLDNPFGRSFLIVAEDEGRMVGLRAFMRWGFEAGGRTLRAVRAVDTATHPDHQSRGIFTLLTLRALDELRGDTDLVFNTPNGKSLPGYLKMGWTVTGRVPVAIRPVRPLRVAARVRHLDAADGPDRPEPVVEAVAAAAALEDTAGVEALLAGAPASDARLRTPRTLAFLRWRYGAGSGLGYHAVTVERDGALRGLAIFRVRARGGLWEATVADLIVERGDAGTAGRLLAAVRRAGPVDHVACALPAGSDGARAARRRGFLPAPGGVTLVTNVLRPPLAPDPMDLRAWAFSLGDLEVF